MSYHGNIKISDIINKKLNEFCKSLIGNKIYFKGECVICKYAEYISCLKRFDITDENDQKFSINENESFAIETIENENIFYQ